MAPKFQGDEDEPHAEKRQKYLNKPQPDRGVLIPLDQANGTVAEVYPNQSAVRLDGHSKPAVCAYRTSTLAIKGAFRERSPVCVGDRVRVEAGVIVGRSGRRNSLARRSPNSRNALVHVLVANLDLLVVVSSAQQPDFSPGIVDRFLAAAAAGKIPALLCVNKADLLGPQEEKPWLRYAAAGTAVVEASAKSGVGVDRLSELVRGKAAAFCGHSGVGKTSLLRKLLGNESYGKTGEISSATGKGRHTTTGAVLLPGPGASTWIDTPGIMTFEAYLGEEERPEK